MANLTYSTDANPDTIVGARCLVPTGPGVPIPTARTGVIGGTLLIELQDRRRGGNNTLTVLPAAFAFGRIGGSGHLVTGNVTAIDPDALYAIEILDPAGDDANPWPTIAALAVELAP